MIGLMQDRPMLVSDILEHARRWHADIECVTLLGNGLEHRQTYRQTAERASQLAHALTAFGVGVGTSVGILAMNNHQHLELWYAASGIGAVAHSINPRLSAEQVSYVISDADDQLLFVDPMFLPLVKAIRSECPNLKEVIVLESALADTDGSAPEERNYEALLLGHPIDYNWPMLDERTANAICHTSGTTGVPKGVRYSHRSNILHAMATAHKDVLCLGATDTVLPMVPFFHANGWGVPYACLAYGAGLMMCGAQMDGESLSHLIDKEQVTIALGVPTICQSLLEYVRQSGAGLASLERIAIAGSAAPASMIIEFAKYGVDVVHAWGMTETSPVATANVDTGITKRLPAADRVKNKQKQGRPVFGVDIKITDDLGQELAHDGTKTGRLFVRGHWVLNQYHGQKAPAVDAEGWFDTGDIASIDQNGFMQITDRAKDLIKSGGEWISSVDLENTAMGHTDVVGAAAIGVPHPKWGERPILLVILREGSETGPDDLETYLSSRVSKVWMPDQILIVDALPLGATGKVQKASLRLQYADLYRSI